MATTALYVYGVVKFSPDLFYLDWHRQGIAEKEVYMIGEGKFGAVVHDCEEKPYPTEDPLKIKEMLIAHNEILDQTREDFAGVIPLPFNTIIKNGSNSAHFNLKKWLSDDQERLERIWNKVKEKKEYGLRIYYEQKKLLQEAAEHQDIKNIKRNSEGKGSGVSYLLQGKAQAKTKEIFQEKINKLKQEFYEEIKKIAGEVVISPSRISLWEEKELLLNLSVLIEEKRVSKIIEFLAKKGGDFPFHVTGPFAPYSFVGND